MVLEDAKQRIAAMSKVHQILYASKSFSKVNFPKYIELLTNEMKVTYLLDKREIKIILDLKPIILNIDAAIPCGLLLNELLVNSFQHAFPNKKNGRIDITLKKKGKTFELKVSDDGIGMQRNPLVGRRETLGLKLVRMRFVGLGGCSFVGS